MQQVAVALVGRLVDSYTKTMLSQPTADVPLRLRCFSCSMICGLLSEEWLPCPMATVLVFRSRLAVGSTAALRCWVDTVVDCS